MNRWSMLAALVLLSGCAQVPTSGPVVEVGPSVPEVASGGFVRALARPPRPGMDPAQIVQGFLDASSSFEDRHAVARMYLTDAASSTWDPAVGVRVYGNDTETLGTPSERVVTLAAAQVGAISARSQYIPAPPGAVLSEQFGLVRQAGEWRIGELPQGLLLSRAAVERSYREFQTYYVARPGGILAPDQVLFASSQRDVTADLVQALLAGPGTWLAPAVLNAFPSGTRVNAVDTAEGIVRVDLSSEVLQADDVARQQLSAQLVWTLRQVPGVRALVITADGQAFPVPGVEPVQPRTAWADFDPDGLPLDVPWYATRSGAVLSTDTSNVSVTVPGAAGSGQPPVTSVLVTLDRTAVAATSDAERLLTSQLESGSRWRNARTTGTSAGGSWDRTGLLWLPEADGGVQVVNVLGSQSVPGGPGQVRSVQISRDGSRALVVAGPRDDARAYLLRIDREATVPRISRPRQLPTGPVRAAAWSSDTQVALLVAEPEQPPQVATVDLGLFSVRLLGGPPQARTVAAAPDRPLLSGTADGQVWQFTGSAWVPSARGRHPRYPG
jgi:hypothetical protein